MAARKSARKQVKEAVTRVRSKEFFDEPEFHEPIAQANDIRLVKALNYYNIEMRDSNKMEKMRTWTVEYAAQAGFEPADLEVLKKMEDWRVTSTIAAVSRMLLNGAEMAPSLVAAHVMRIRDVVTAHARHNPPKPVVAKVAEGPRYSDREHRMVTAVEEALDVFFDSGYQTRFSTYDILSKAQATRAQAEAVTAKYEPTASELTLLKKGDKAVKEGYSSLTRTQINSYVDIVNSIIIDAQRYTTNRKLAVVRKPRKRKEKAAAELVRKVSYLKEFPELQLVSVDPSTIVGAESVWLYSTKYKIIKRLVAETGKTLTMSGSTVKGFDLATSGAKTLRRPAETLKLLLGGTRHSVKRLLDDLKTKPSEANGRINPETIIVRVFK